MAIKFIVKEEPRLAPARPERKSPPVLDSGTMTALAEASGEAASVAGSDLFDSEPNAPGRKRKRK